jgi:hypothetical protein
MARKSLVLVQAEAKIVALEAALQQVNHRLTLANTRISELELQVATPEVAPPASAKTAVPQEDCTKCNGTGLYDGKYMCYRCKGKGFLDEADQRRNWGYDKAVANHEVGTPVAIDSFKAISALAKEHAMAGRKPKVVRRNQHEFALYVS